MQYNAMSRINCKSRKQEQNVNLLSGHLKTFAYTSTSFQVVCSLERRLCLAHLAIGIVSTAQNEIKLHNHTEIMQLLSWVLWK